MNMDPKLNRLYEDCAGWCTRQIVRTQLGRYVKENPFSTMALCNILGDTCYVGYALYSNNGISMIKMAGALSAMSGHVLLLAYGDAEIKKALHEKGRTAKIVLNMRKAAKAATNLVCRNKRLQNPHFYAFGLLSLNGVALIADGAAHFNFSGATQCALGVTVAAGCGAYALAGLVEKQSTADVLTKIAPTILLGAIAAQAALIVSTRNPFLLASLGIFGVSTLAGYFTKIVKEPRAERTLFRLQKERADNLTP